MVARGLAALKQYSQFVVYSVERNTTTGKLNKIPTVSVTDPIKWMSYDAAYEFASQQPGKLYIGFALCPEISRIAVVDVDGCRDRETGRLSDLALAMIAILPGAFVEVSISGTGIHIWFSYRDDMPPHACRASGLEFYHENRFFAIGAPYSADGFVNGSVDTDLTCVLPTLIGQYFPPSASAAIAQGWTAEPCDEWSGPSDDAELLRRALSSRPSAAAAFGDGVTFKNLWEAKGDVLGKRWPDANGREYDASAADASLAQRLAYWTGKDCTRIERIMFTSALVRDKWEREDYLHRTICGAVARCTDVLQDKRPPTPPAHQPVASEIALTPIERTLVNVGTQDSVALIFANRMKEKMLYDRTRNVWMEWDGTRWRRDDLGRAYDLIRAISRELNYESKAGMASSSFCDGVDRHLQHDSAFAITSDQFDRDNYLLNTPAGTIDLRTGNMNRHDSGDRITLCTGVAPDPRCSAVFLKFLEEITEEDRSLMQYHQVSMGACLSGAVESHWMLFWTGTGRNGKNTLGDLVQEAMGDYARKIPTSTLMAKTFESHPTEIANLQGIRLATSSEINDGDHWDEARINEITGDATLSARVMRGDYFTFRRTHKHLIYGNYRPQLRSVADGIRSRIKILPFKVSFLGRENADLPRLLREHLGYVLTWLLEGHRLWLMGAKKLPQCEAVENESEEYFKLQSTPQLWLSERVEIIPNDDRPAIHLPKVGDFYRDFKTWKEARGEKAVSQSRWLEAMRAYERVRTKLGFHFRGLRLLPLPTGGLLFPPAVSTTADSPIVQ